MEWAIVFAGIFVYMSWVFVIAWKNRRLDIVDIGWGGALIIAACTSLLLGEKGWLQYLITTLVVIWGVRLGLHIAKRFRKTLKEDPRYGAMRRTWKSHFALNAYFRIFVIQALLAFLIAVPAIAVNTSFSAPVGLVAVSGAVVWLIGFLVETIGDAQLKSHLTNPNNKNKLMTRGLWRYTRHPNYFGEALQWWGVYIIALSIGDLWWTIVGPITITVLLLFVSGIPLTEKRFEGRPGWANYKKRTSAFVPWPPRSGK